MMQDEQKDHIVSINNIGSLDSGMMEGENSIFSKDNNTVGKFESIKDSQMKT